MTECGIILVTSIATYKLALRGAWLTSLTRYPLLTLRTYLEARFFQLVLWPLSGFELEIVLTANLSDSQWS